MAAAGPAPGEVARGPDPPIHRFTILSVDDGLPQSSVQAIVQDTWGFVWLGTQEGLSRYDGYRFQTWHASRAPGSLGNDEINDLALDGQGGLWVATAAGLEHLDTATGRVIPVGTPGRARTAVTAVVADPAGRVWFAPEGGGLWVAERVGEPGQRDVRRVPDARLPPESPVTALAAGRASLWAACDGRLVAVTPGPPDTAEVRRDGLGAVSALAVDPGGRVWIGRADGRALVRFDPVSERVESYPQVPRHVLALLADGGRAVWVGARAGGLSRLDVATGHVVTRRRDPSDPASLSEDDVAELFLDRSGRLWIGTWNGGASRLDPYAQALRTLEHRPHDPGSMIPDVIAMTETEDGRLWVASRNEQLAVGDPASGRFRVLSARAPRRVTGMGQAGGRLYVATEGGLLSLDVDGGLPRPLPPALARGGLATARIDRIDVSRDGTLWLASGSSLFEARMDPAGGVAVRERSLPLGARVSALLATPTHLWMGSETGRLAFLERTVRSDAAVRVLELDGPSAADVRHGRVTSLFAGDGVLWAGTRDGLGRVDLENRTLRWLDRRDGLLSSTVAGLLGDRAGRIWVATNRGLTRIDGSGRMLHFGSREGAQGSGYAEGAFARGASGRFYFAGAGITLFDPRRVTADPEAPAVVFTEVEISHARVRPRWRDPASPLATGVHAAEQITLAPDADVLGVEFAGLHFGDPGSHRYRYRLEGFDEEWIETGARRRVATYTDLPPGTYRLRVLAATKHGVWSPEEATLGIRIRPHWWQTAWARWGAALLALLAIAGVFKLRLWRLERDRERLEHLVRERTAELEVSNRQRRQAEVSAALQSIVAGTAHEVRNPLFAISATVDALCLRAPDERHARLHAALHREVARLSSLTDRLLEYGTAPKPRLEPLRLEELVAEAWQGCQTAAEGREVELVTRFEPGLPVVEGDRPSLARSFANLFENAIEHAPRGTAVIVSGFRESGAVVVRVEDSGPGIPPGDLPRIYDPFFTTRTGASGLGLSLAQRFVEGHGGRLAAENRDEGGARFSVRLPLPRA